MALIDDLIQQINDEILNERTSLVRQMLNEEMRNFKFTAQNLSPNIIQMFMAAREIYVPLPEKKEIPQGAQDSADEGLSFVNINTAAIFTDLMSGNNVYLYGRAGTGKTFLAKKIAEDLLGRRTGIVNCNQFTSPINIIGGQTIEGYKQGVLSECWEKGYVFILDELPKLDPNTAGLLNEALAQSADTEQTTAISKEKYDSFKKQLDESGGKYVGFELKEEGGKYYKISHVTITDGKGDKLRKNPNFCVIATGNTDLKTLSTNFSGNNRQDYSLVDRFAGSFYKIDYDVDLEKSLIYSRVREVSYILRQFLDNDPNSVESISLRTMLNFNRIFEQEYLRKIKSPLANPSIKINGVVEAKTLQMSVESFVETLPATKRTDLYTNTDLAQLMASDFPIPVFIAEFKEKHKIDPLTKEAV